MNVESFHLESFYYWTTFNFKIPTAFVFQLEVYYKVDRLLTGLSAQQKGTTAPWYSNKTSLYKFYFNHNQCVYCSSFTENNGYDIDFAPLKRYHQFCFQAFMLYVQTIESEG